jgi:hypothetical protein
MQRGPKMVALLARHDQLLARHFVCDNALCPAIPDWNLVGIASASTPWF